jgi:thymidylate kinase
VRTTRLILLEGVPGSGKSTLAQFLARELTAQRIAHHWWYEEDRAHPVYVFHDPASLQKVLDDLARGKYRHVVAAALDKWREFGTRLQSSDRIVVLDSCLLGYLTWTLFPFDVPVDEIQRYLGQVEEILRSADPCLIYLYQEDLAQALRTICERRAGDTRDRLIRNATQYPYGLRMGLSGFEGMVAFWTDYRRLADEATQATGFATLAIETGAGDWPTYQQQALDFLEVPPTGGVVVPSTELQRFVGTYVPLDAADVGQGNATVRLENDYLVVDGLPQVWPHTRLTATSAHTFDIDSLPFAITFATDSAGVVDRMIVTGPELLSGTVAGTLAKEHGVPNERDH